MVEPARKLLLLSAVMLAVDLPSFAADPLHAQIDKLILARANGRRPSAVADDAEFLRRVCLDLVGHIPSVQETRTFLSDKNPDKRVRLIDRLLAGPEYPRRMQELFNVMLMERLGENAEWAKYLHDSFAANKPWDKMAREILSPAHADAATRGAGFFYAKRLESYGANPVDYAALTRDVGRLFLGMDLRCAQCHDHRFIKDYKQDDFQGLFAFFQNTARQDAVSIAEKPTTQKVEFMSVFKKVKKTTGPRIPGLPEIEIPAVKKGEEYLQPPNPKTNPAGVLRFSPLTKLAEQLPAASDPAFSRNIANRLWFILMGRGLVHPLDLHHSANPPSHPELLDLLAREITAHKFDVKWFLCELALSDTYQRSSVLPEGQDQPPPESFLTANQKRLSAEQLLASMLEATGERARVSAGGDKALAPLRAKFLKAFANPAREPEDEFMPSLKATLFVLNDGTVLGWLKPQPGNLVERLGKLTDTNKIAEELHLSVLSRMPNEEERAAVAEHLGKGGRREAALGQLVWALLASTEFGVNY